MAAQLSALKTMLMVFALIFASTSPVDSQILEGITMGEVIGMAANVISAGSSLAGTTLAGIAASDYRVTCAIQVENWTRFPLKLPSVHLYKGETTSPPTSILPGRKEAFAVRKANIVAAGVEGVASWLVGDQDRRMVLMLSAPWNFDFYDNVLGVGMTIPGVSSMAPGDEWFIQMYENHRQSKELKFSYRKFSKYISPVIFRNEKFEIEGLMNSVHHAEIKVILRPLEGNWEDLAPSLREALKMKHLLKQII